MNGTTTLQLPWLPGCAGIARMVVTAHAHALSAAQVKDARLLVTELVTNAFEHGDGQICLTVDSDAAGLRAQVVDEGTMTTTSSDGHGLRFVEKLADTWGLELGASRVWFTLATETSPVAVG
jgi:anti-sigma regulatory factor (Ser/Thr protein kinase)